MTKKKGIASKLFLVLVALTLLSCCFLGTTFARYTSGGTGKATTAVAKWDISFGETEDAEVSISMEALSPSMAAWTSGSNRTNMSQVVKVATLSNNGDVDADVTFAVGDTETFTLQESAQFGTGYGDNGGELTGDGASEWQAGQLFSITLCDQQGSPVSDIKVSAKGSYDVYAIVTWTSYDSNGEAVADAIDTWVGENVTSVAFSITYTAVQASTASGGLVSGD